MLKDFGFREEWIRCVMKIITSSFSLILVNAALTQLLKPCREIKKADTLSPFLFVLMEEGLGRTINAMQYRITGVDYPSTR